MGPGGYVEAAGCRRLTAVWASWTWVRLSFENAKAFRLELAGVLGRYLAKDGPQGCLVQRGVAPEVW